MGGWPAVYHDYSYHREVLKWIKTPNILNVSGNGTYTMENINKTAPVGTLAIRYKLPSLYRVNRENNNWHDMAYYYFELMSWPGVRTVRGAVVQQAVFIRLAQILGTYMNYGYDVNVMLGVAGDVFSDPYHRLNVTLVTISPTSATLRFLFW